MPPGGREGGSRRCPPPAAAAGPGRAGPIPPPPHRPPAGAADVSAPSPPPAPANMAAAPPPDPRLLLALLLLLPPPPSLLCAAAGPDLGRRFADRKRCADPECSSEWGAARRASPGEGEKVWGWRGGPARRGAGSPCPVPGARHRREAAPRRRAVTNGRSGERRVPGGGTSRSSPGSGAETAGSREEGERPRCAPPEEVFRSSQLLGWGCVFFRSPQSPLVINALAGRWLCAECSGRFARTQMSSCSPLIQY